MIEVLKLALKALNAGEHAHLIMNTDGIKDKVRQAIAELESQELKQVTVKDFVHIVEGKEDLIGRPVYFAQWPNGNAHPPQREWIGLTDDEIKKTAKKHRWHESNVEPHLMPVFRSLEAKLKQKNGYAEENT